MATVAQWVAGARPRTLPNSVVPVAVGTGVAIGADPGGAVWWKAGLALVVALALQIGVNYANDYSDGVRGTDADRVGPARLTAAGVARPRQVFTAAWLGFGVAAVAGLVLVATTSWWLLLLGVAAILAAWTYTGGSNPYGYRALGELSVFVFFGLAAVVGTAFVQLWPQAAVPWAGWVAAIPVGLLSCSVLVINNLRDIPTDAATGKRTLAVVLGDRGTRLVYLGCIAGAFLAAIATAVASWWTLLVLVTVPLAVRPWLDVARGAQGAELVQLLGATGRFQLAFGTMYALGLALG
ncbi:1,4-dihydroxy-2-naphthoate polyprenyltransferase [Lipingzhangella sp. LS1_29]|uniref:1,4-dihydroxy-2-naphthoate octaprenyltransferase n=1 Tax=Lipingzhangella rawalii TaxID=2055835 RepID=A0ABU2H8U5_9ACTN|nr:1,4-dihydroxy-2-naphthoate polyprenyltransferase [Lipingzhangella rawalii]MDS1271698.1 1,4-dihydroxy-2-naphthoate polyprenyltransferase [Lipingzhangella rawalii]